MSAMFAPLQELANELLSSIKVGWRADRGRINLTASDELANRCVINDVQCLELDGVRKVHRLGGREAEHSLAAQAQRLFGTNLVSFHARSGYQANQAVFKSILQPGDCVLCVPDPELEMTLDTLYVSAITPRITRIAAPCLSNQLLDYEALAKQVLTLKPKCLVAGHTVYSRHIDYRTLRSLADSVGALLIVDVSRTAGLIAAGLHPNPLDHAHVITGATHKSLQGPRGGFIMARDGQVFQSITLQLNRIGVSKVPYRIQLALNQCLAMADSPEQKARQQLSLNNARVMADFFKSVGIGVFAGGTDIQSISIDLATLGLSARHAAIALGRLGITVETRGDKPDDTTLVLSTYPVSARGMDTSACKRLAEAIAATLIERTNLKAMSLAIRVIDDLCTDHPPLATPLDYIQL